MSSPGNDRSIELLETGRALFDRKLYDEAVPVLAEAFTCDPQNTDIITLYGWVLLFARKWDTAEQISRVHLTRSPEDSGASYRLGCALEGLERLPEAEAAYRASIAAGNVDAVVYSDLAGVVARQDRSDEAIEYLKKAIALEPDYAQAHCDLAELYFGREDIVKATVTLEKYLESYPDAVDALCDLASYYTVIGNDARYEQLAARVASLDAERAAALRNEREEFYRDNPEIIGVRKFTAMMDRIPRKELGAGWVNLAHIVFFLVLSAVAMKMFPLHGWGFLLIIPAYIVTMIIRLFVLFRIQRKRPAGPKRPHHLANPLPVVRNVFRKATSREFLILRKLLYYMLAIILAAGTIAFIGIMTQPVYGSMISAGILLGMMRLRKEDKGWVFAKWTLGQTSRIVSRAAVTILRDVVVAFVLFVVTGTMFFVIYKIYIASQSTGATAAVYSSRILATGAMMMFIFLLISIKWILVDKFQSSSEKDLDPAVMDDPNLKPAEMPSFLFEMGKYFTRNPTLLVVIVGIPAIVCFGVFSQMGGAGIFSRAGIIPIFKYLSQEFIGTISLEVANIFGFELVSIKPDNFEAVLFAALVKVIMFAFALGYIGSLIMSGRQTLRKVANTPG